MKRTIAFCFALALVLALGASPAFAAGESVGTPPGDFANNEQGTQVSLIADTSASGNISATVPLTVTLAVMPNGTITAPTNYAIENTSVFDIKVAQLNAIPETGYKFTKAAFSGAKEMNLTLQPASGTAVNLADFTAKTPVPAATAADWNLSAKGGASSALNLTFAGSVNQVGDITTAKQAFRVVYTIATGTAVNNP